MPGMSPSQTGVPDADASSIGAAGVLAGSSTPTKHGDDGWLGRLGVQPGRERRPSARAIALLLLPPRHKDRRVLAVKRPGEPPTVDRGERRRPSRVSGAREA